MFGSIRFFALGILAGVMVASLARAYDPPEIIGELRGEPPDSQNFGRQFCWVGDQNGDGYDDILVNHDPSHLEGHVNAVKLYFGGEQIDNEPDMVFRPRGTEYFGERIEYLGDLTGNNTKWFFISSVVYENNRCISSKKYFYRGGEDLDTIPDVIITPPPGCGYLLGSSPNKRPSDFNGDGYMDLIACYHAGNQVYFIQVFYGSDEFDTIPDFSFRLRGISSFGGSLFLSGYDVNGDGYDDFLLVYRDQDDQILLNLYLGGDPMDTTAYWQMEDFHDGERVLDPFTVVMLPDVNDDGYDDWGMYWQQSFQGWEIDGYYVYFGGEEPDAEPDLDLEGNHNIFGTDGLLSGGDFNGDGIGDIVTTNRCGYMYNGELHLYFGSQFIDESASIVINTLGEYGIGALGASLGSVGDFNDDGSDDFVINLAPAGRASGVILLLAGNAEWEVFVPNCEEKLPETLNFDIYPNPFNDSVKLRLFTARRGSYRIQMLSIRGSVVWETVINGDTEQVSVSAEKTPAGVYIFRCRSISSANKCQIQYRKAVLVR